MATYKEIRDQQIKKARVKDLKRTIKRARGHTIAIKTVYGDLALQHYLSDGWHLEADAGGQTGAAHVYTLSRRVSALTADLIQELAS